MSSFPKLADMRGLPDPLFDNKWTLIIASVPGGGDGRDLQLQCRSASIPGQNHSFAVDTESLKGTGLTLTHLNLLDDTAEGVECRADRIFSVQYHPESAPGPQDSTYLFDKFIKMMEESQNA
jgi:carbamoyl-phosphate synthase small subunit